MRSKILICFLGLGLGSLILRAQSNSFPASGNVGVGTAAPVAKLDIRGPSAQNTYTEDTTLQDDLRILSSQNRPYDGGVLTIGGIWGPTGYIKTAAKNGPAGALVLGTRRDPNDTIMQPGLVIDTGGYVGIGTTNPQTTLHVIGPITAGFDNSTWGEDYLYGAYGDGHLFAIGSLYSSGASFLGFAVKAKHLDRGYVSSTGIAAARSAVEANSGYVAFLTGSGQTSTDGGPVSISERMRVDAAGNVGIGTTSPTQKLSVNGTIRAKEVIVDTGWSDYVFAPDYRLASLSEVEQHIKTEGHLPGIPSASDVAEHGVTVGEMQAKLLAKIEELTLHQIEQEKALERLNAENAALRSRNDQVEQRLRMLEKR